jgi:hypothetical protein
MNPEELEPPPDAALLMSINAGQLVSAGSKVSIRLYQAQIDAFGSRRFTPQYFVLIDATNTTDGLHESEDHNLDVLIETLNRLNCFELILRCSTRCRSVSDLVTALLACAGFCHDVNWPVSVSPDMPERGTFMRMSRRQDILAGDAFADAYREALRRFSPAEAIRQVVNDLQADILRLANNQFTQSEFDAAHHVQWVMMAGSTSRMTYEAFPVDFDLVVLTEKDHSQYDPHLVRQMTEELLASVTALPSFRQFTHSVSEFLGAKLRAVPAVELASFGERGTQSLVARYDLIQPGVKEPKRYGFIDVTFGRIPQLAGYEIWVQRLFRRLGPKPAARLQSEIRLAKAVFKRLGDVYGPLARGLKAHSIEQMVIQSLNYRASGDVVGTLDNLLRLIAEEASDILEPANKAIPPIELFSERFSFLHPGWWEQEVGLADTGKNLDLMAFLSTHGEAAANAKWRRIVALARAYNQIASSRKPWTIETLMRETFRSA